MASCEMSKTQFTEFLAAVFCNLARFSVDGSIHFQCMDWRHMSEMLEAGNATYSELKNLCVTDAHHRILDAVRGLDERWVFPGRGASGHVVAWDHSEVPGTLHSLRHTFATVAVEAGILEEVVGRLLNHASKTITGQRYVKPQLDFLRAAMQIIVAELERRLAG